MSSLNFDKIKGLIYTEKSNKSLTENKYSFKIEASCDKKEIASANQVKIIWKTPMSSLYTQNAIDLWSSEPSFLVAGGLRYAIDATTPAELLNFYLDIENVDSINEIASAFSYAGYFLVDSEVFEYDAIEYEYEPLDSTTKVSVFIASDGDWAQYRALSKTGAEYFKPTGKYRIKARALFGTTAAAHDATGGVVSNWYQVPEDVWN